MHNGPLAKQLPFHSLARERLAATRVLVIGDVLLDRYWLGDVTRISPEAPVPVVQVGLCEDRLGGAANVARNIAALGAQASLVGVIGDDDAGASVARLLRHAAIRDCTCRRAGAQTIVKLRGLGQRQQLLRIDFDGARELVALDPDTLSLSALIGEHDVVVLSDYAKGCISDAQALITIARECRRPILVDPKGDDFSVYAQATMITPNLSELKQVIGRWRCEDELSEKAQALRDALKIDALLLTRSSEGMTLFNESGRHHYAAVAREVFDVSGAGDTVIAVLATLLGCGLQQPVAIRLANRAAGLVVGKLGTATISIDELLSGLDVTALQ